MSEPNDKKMTDNTLKARLERPKRADHEGDESGRCGGCGSRNIKMSGVRMIGICRDCKRVQELEYRDWPESQMCDNCAFRKGSPEQSDPYRWAEIQETLERGQYFHCHKGLAYNPKTGAFTAPDVREGRVTVCAGWMNAYLAKFKRDDRAKLAQEGGE